MGLAACGEASRDATTKPPASSTTGGSGAQGGGAATLTPQGGMQGLNVGSAGDDSGSRRAMCASDLRTVIDDQGALIRQCPSDQGCEGGACVPVCDAVARSNGSIGCDFLALKPTSFYSAHNPEYQLDRSCYAVVLTNAWSQTAKITVSRGGKTLDPSKFGRILKGSAPQVSYEPLPDTGVPPNEVAVLFLSGTPLNGAPLDCPIAAVAAAEDASIEGSGRGSAFHIVSDTPLSAYDILPYRHTHTGGMGPSASLLLPTSTWRTNYLALAPKVFGSLERVERWIVGQPWLAVVAREDATTVRVAATESLPGGNGLASAPKGQVVEYTLAAGEAIQWIDNVDSTNLTGTPQFKLPLDPSGTVFGSDKPIGLWAGHTFMPIMSATSGEYPYFQSVHQQMAPIRALGHEYVGAGIVTRRVTGEPESVPYRLLGVADGTELTWDPLPAPGAPLKLEQGQVAEFETSSFFSVRSQDAEHPFVFSEYMPTAPAPDGPQDPLCSDRARLGEEDWLSLIPTQQFLTHYVFFSEPTYSTTNLVVVRQKGPPGFQDVELDCLGTIDGWQPVGGLGMFEVAHVDLVRLGVPVKECATARHVARSDGAFGVTVWGTDCSASYGYAAGGDFGPVNDVIVAPTIR